MEKPYWSHGKYEEECGKHAEIARGCKKCIVELGVLWGDTTKILLDNNSNVTVYGIDPIIPDSMDANMIGDINRINALKRYANFVFIKDYSYNVVKTWTEEISYIFIDADHRYEAVKRDFEDWFPFVEQGGIISLHDSAVNRGGAPCWPDPSRLADELLKDDRLEYVDTVHSMTVFKKK